MYEKIITEARELCEGATPGPWESANKSVRVAGSQQEAPKGKYAPSGYEGGICNCLGKSSYQSSVKDQVNVQARANAAFIARSRTLVPELCDELEKAQRWIPVTERLPEHRRSVLVYCPESNNVYCGDYQYKDEDIFRDVGCWYYFVQGLGNKIGEKVTHWMSLPDCPAGK